MFKYVATIAAIAATTVNAEEGAFKLKTFTSTDCKGTAFVDTTLEFGKCVAVTNNIKVPELNDASFGTIKYSPDAASEFYMFTNTAACEEYGNKFNPQVEAAFIRSPGFGCKECQQCGNIKSVWMEKVDETSKTETKTETKVKQDSAASTVAISGAAVVASVAAMFF